MAIFEQGILGGFSGKVGPVVGSTWKGKDVMKARSRKRKGGSSVKQIDQQLRFSAVAEFQAPFAGLLDVTFKDYAIDITAQNAAFSYNYGNALAGRSPDYSIDYSKALVSRGGLPNADNGQATVSNGTVYFTWTDNSGDGRAASTDTSVLVVYCAEKNMVKYTWAGADRSTGAAQMDASSFIGKKVQTWLAFLSADGNEVASSIFTGELVIDK